MMDLEPFTEAVTRILQEALHAMCLLAEEAKADVIREQETARKAIEEAPQVIKENSEDTEKFNSLTSEVEALKASLQSERQAAEDLRNAFSEAEARNSELATNLENVTRRVDQLCESASLQSEQQAAEDLRKALSLAEARNLELTTKLENVTRRVDQLCESESQEVLVKCISQNLGYDGGKPVAACVIYKCLLHWRSFEVERTNIFDRIVKIIASAIEVSDSYKVSDNNEVLAYWLSNSAMLVCVLQRTFRSSTMLSSKGLMSGVLVSYLDRQSQVVPKCPAMLFKKQLIDFLQKIYGMMRDNLKKEILPHLEYCKQAPWPFSNPKERIVHWQRIVGSLRSYLNIMKANNHPIRGGGFIKINAASDVNDIELSQLIHEKPSLSFLLSREEGSPS